MAVVNSGFKGKLNESTFASIHALVSIDAVGGPNDWRVSQGTGRQISTAAGNAFARGVLSVSDSAILSSVSTPTNGQWFLAVRRINWITRTVSIELLAGATTSTTTPSSVPTSFPATENTPGVRYDHKLAWVWANSATTSLVIVDLRNRALDIPRAGDATARDAYYGVPTTEAARAYLNGMTWERTDKGWTEVYRNGPTPGWVVKGGLILVRPTSVTSQSGSISIQNDGTVQFTSVSAARLIGMFTTDFDRYLMQLYAYGTVNGQGINGRFSSAGTSQATNSYYFQGVSQSGDNAPGAFRARPNTLFDIARCGSGNGSATEAEITVVEPMNSGVKSRAHWISNGSDGTTDHYISAAGNYGANEAHDGFTFFDAGSALLTGYARVYGYAKG